MDYSTLSLVELKQLAKNHVPKIKQYYVKSRSELISILSMEEFPEEMKIEKMRIGELREEARKRGHLNIWKLRRKELLDLLYPSTQQDNQNNKSAEEHNNPESGKSE
jgi:hypothetical protein